MKRMILGLCLAASSCLWASPLTVTGKAGVSEFYLRYTLRYFPRISNLCRHEPYCSTGFEGPLKELYDSGLFETTSLLFLSSREMGSRLYEVDSNGVIRINKDLLFVARNGSVEPWLYVDSVDFLTRVWSDQLKWNDRLTTALRGRLTDLAVSLTDRVILPDPELKQFAFSLFREPASSLVIEDTSTHEQSVTLEVPFVTQLSCGPSTGVEGPISELRISSAKWMPVNHLAHDHELLTISGTLDYKCENPRTGRLIPFTSNYRVQMDALLRSQQWALSPGTVRILQNGIRALSSGAE